LFLFQAYFQFTSHLQYHNLRQSVSAEKMPRWIKSLIGRQRNLVVSSGMDIGAPTGLTHDTHVKVNASGALEGLPADWRKILDTMVTAAEQKAHPDAAFQAMKFYQNHNSTNLQPQEEFPPVRRDSKKV
jgi:P21-Rho-binding domain